MQKSTVISYRLLLIERLSRELAELVLADANHHDTPDKAERPEQMKKLWNEIVRHVGVVEMQVTTKPAGDAEAGGN